MEINDLHTFLTENTLNQKTDLLICFVSFDFPELNELIDLIAGLDIQHLVYSSPFVASNGVLSDCGASVMLLQELNNGIQVHALECETSSTPPCPIALFKLAQTHCDEPALIAFFHFPGLDLQQFIEHVQLQSKKPIQIAGSYTTDIMNPNRSLLMANGQKIHRGAAFLSIDTSKVSMENVMVSGWSGVGAKWTITRCNGNELYEISGRPAIELLRELFNAPHASSSELISICGRFPLCFEDGADFIIRAPLDINEKEGFVQLGGGVKEGQSFRFSIPPGWEVIESTINQIQDFSTQHPHADALITFECTARQWIFGDDISHELDGIYKAWNSPMITSFSFGEIGNIRPDSARFNNESCVAVVLNNITNKKSDTP